jgi:hypothetical protein
VQGQTALGPLVYWIACFIAAAALCLGVYATTEGTPDGWYSFAAFSGGGVLISIVGLAVRHALTPARSPAQRSRQGREG